MQSIESYSDVVKEEIGRRNVVFMAPTGAGKSTLVPQWLAEHGPVLVVEPRRIALQALAQRVAMLMGVSLGEKVGYHVRDGQRRGKDTQILFVTTGIALRMMSSGAHREFATVVLDEFHERSLDLDSSLALLLKDDRRMLVCSATLQAKQIATHIEGTLIQVEGRQFAVDISHMGNNRLPSDERLSQRVKGGRPFCPFRVALFAGLSARKG